MGINFSAIVELSTQTANAVLFGLLNPRIGAHREEIGTPLTSAGLKLLYDRDQWVATISVEKSQNSENQLACGVNFNMNRPTKNHVENIREAENLRQWFERKVKDIVGEGFDE